MTEALHSPFDTGPLAGSWQRLRWANKTFGYLFFVHLYVLDAYGGIYNCIPVPHSWLSSARTANCS